MNVKWDNNFPSEYSMTIFNELGQVFYKKREIEKFIESIDLSAFKDGVYFLKIESEELVSFQKFLIMKKD